MFYENFADQKAHEKHYETPHILAWQAKIDDLFAGIFAVTI